LPDELPIRVGLVLPDLAGGGAQRVFIDLAHGLLERSVAVDIVLLHGDGPLRATVSPKARVVVLGGNHMSTSVPRLVAYLRRERPDGLITALHHVNLASVLATRSVRPRIPLVVTHHNTLSVSLTHPRSRRQRLVPLMGRLLYPLADHVVAVSERAADDLAAVMGLRRRRIDVVNNAVDVDRLAAGSAEPLEHQWLTPAKRSHVILAAGRLSDQKDFGTLIRAVALLPEDFRLIVLGEGEGRSQLEELADQLGVGARVDLHGFVPNPYPYFRAADVFVLSSRWEGLPTVLIEALALGTRTVATDIRSGPREILAGGRWGRLVPERNPAAMADAIQASINEEEPDGRAASQPYDHRAVASRYLELLGRRTPPPESSEPAIRRP